MLVSNALDELFCQKIHESIPSRSPAILTIFNNDAFGHDSYLELRYPPDDSIAHLYFCGNGVDKLQTDALMEGLKNHRSAVEMPSLKDILDSSNLFPYINTARISGKKLDYILEILDDCQRIHFKHDSLGRDGNIVTLKSFWGEGAEFAYWMTATDSHTRVEELVWLLSDYLPRPARDSLQGQLSPDRIEFLRKL